MNQLEKLDYLMKQLYLDLMKYNEDDIGYKKTLSALNQQYQTFKMLLALKDDGIHNTYYFKYSDIGAIEKVLTSAGYIEQAKKSSTR